MKLDLVIDNARVHTMDPLRRTAARVGIWRGRVAGLDEEVEGDDAARVVNAGGRTVVPGFVDCHTHLVWQGLALGAVDISACRSVEDALEVVRAAALRAPSGWLDVSGYDQRPLGRHLEAADLDRASPGRKVYVTHLSGHACVVSGAVLAEIPDDELTHPGVARGNRGEPNGLFLENAQEVARRRRLPYSLEEICDALRRAGALCAAQGVTFCAEAGTGAGLVNHSPVEPAAYQAVSESGELAVRVQLMVAGDFLHGTGLSAAGGPCLGIDLGLRTGFGGERLSLGAAKFWLDGGLSARTAALCEPYTGSNEKGSLTERLEDYRRAVVACHAGGWQLALHAIGDQAIDVALDLIEESAARHPVANSRPRIEHCGLVRPDQLERLARNGVVAVVQPFLRHFGDDYAAIVGPQRAAWLYRGRSFLDRGVVVAGSSDRPVTPGAPLAGVSFLVSRRSLSGTLVGAGEALSVAESLFAHTVAAAYACRAEGDVGSLSAGKQADLVVLDADPFEVAPDDIADIPVAATMVAGQATHDGVGLFAD
ncbi:MAG TPA: amidohydrolase [Acidimicrobiales bacterium]|nr:amidohydrolase [Acidimicrobiales bacterium]